MTEQSIPSIAPLRNVAALSTLADRVKNRSYNLPGMATFYGPSGDGKSTAAVYVRNKLDAVLVQCVDTWTRSDLCVAILREMGLETKGTLHAKAERIAENLVITDRILMIDEADILLKKRMIEVTRGIYEMSLAPVILIGEEQMPQKLRAWERIHNRMLDWVATHPGELSDVRLLAKIYAPGVNIDDQLSKRILKESQKSIRRVCVNLDRLREVAAIEGCDVMTEKVWGDRRFFTGEAPAPRGGAAINARRSA